MPFFSVIIPLHNKETYIEETLKSILNQTFADFEIVIVNDGSTDKSVEKISHFPDSRIKVFHQENQGASIARNTGIENATAEYIAFLDADDLWFPIHLEALKNLIETHPEAGIFASRYQLVFKNNHIYVPRFEGISEEFTGIVPDYFESSFNYAVATSSSIAVPRSIFKEIGGFKSYISSGQDTDMWLRIALKYPVAITNEITASYLHFVDESLSKTSILKKNIKRFEDYKEEEAKNKNLKKYLDLYRMEYALQYKIAGKKLLSRKLFDEIHLPNISWKSKFLYRLPRFLLLQLLNVKRYLRSLGIDFSVYH